MYKRINYLPAAFLILVYFTSLGWADGWRGMDSATQYGLSQSLYPGTDNPSPPSYPFTVAPDPTLHDMLLYDYSNNGNLRQPSTDYVLDRKMRWNADQIRTFNSNYAWNYVHQILVNRELYEADDYISTNLPNVTHNEDDDEGEEETENTWAYGHYEEKEIGTLYPEFLTPNKDYYIYSYWIQQNIGTGHFRSEAELTESGVHDFVPPFWHDDWYPRGQRGLGEMTFTTESGGIGNPVIWDFDTAGKFEGWVPKNTTASSVNSGILFIDPAGNDPFVVGPEINETASYYKYVQLRMASNAQDGNGRIYFKTQASNFYSDDKSVPFPVNNCVPGACNGGAPFRDYSILMYGRNDKWSGTITGIRVDPADNGRAGTNVDTIGFDYIRLSPSEYADSGEIDFELVGEPQSQTVNQGSTTQYNIRVNFGPEFNGPVQDFRILNLPAGFTARFEPTVITSSGGTTTLTIETTSTSPTGTFNLLITAGSSDQHPELANLELVVIPFSQQRINIIPNVFFNGQLWNGGIYLRITGPQGFVLDREIRTPDEVITVPPGYYTIEYVSGGPPNAALSRIWAALPCGASGAPAISCNFTSSSVNNGVFFEFSGSTPATYTIGGRIVDDKGQGVNDILVSLAGSETWYTRTTNTGNYFFYNLTAGGNFSVSPSSSNYIFSPQVIIFSNLNTDGTGNFSANPKPNPAGKITFTSGYNESAEIYAIDASGGPEFNLTNNSVNDAHPAWSPDGSKIAFVSWRDGNKEIYVMNADGSNPRNITNHYEYDLDPAWSPDGSKIAFYSYRDGNAEIYVMNADGSNPQRLTYDSQTIDSEPAWSPDGSKIVFQRFQNYIVDIYVMNADGSNLRNLTNYSSQSTNPAWSPDASKIAFSRDGDIYLMNTDGSNQTNITNNQYGNYDPTWSPDGRMLAFISSRDGRQEIYSMYADGSNQTRLTYSAQDSYDPAWQPAAMPQMVSVTVGANPSGLSYKVDGASYSTARTFNWVSGSSHTISAAPSQSGDASTQYVWRSWSDGGAAEHTVAPTSSATYTANYSTQYWMSITANAGGAATPSSGWYNSGQSVSISASPNNGYSFAGWTGVGNGSYTGTSNPAAVVINGPITETAAFVESIRPVQGTENVVWTGAVGVQISGNSLSKSSDSHGYDAGAKSTQGFISGDGYLEFTASEMTTDRLVGFSRSGTVPSYWAIDFGLRQYYGSLYIIESNGTNRGSVGSYAVGDKLRVAVQGGVVRYYKNGGLLYTSTQAPIYPLLVDACLYDPAATINSAVLSTVFQPAIPTEDVVWVNLVNAQASGNTLSMTPGAYWSGGAVSSKAIASGDGYVEFTAVQTNTARMFGLSNGDLNQNYSDIDFALYATDFGTLQIYESGTYKGTFDNYTSGDKLRVSVEVGAVKYWKINALGQRLLYTSSSSPTYPLRVDTSLYASGTSINNAVIAGNLTLVTTDPGAGNFWTNTVGVSASNNSLTSIAGGWGSAGAVSVKTIASGDGYVELTASETNRSRMCGLSNGDSNQSWQDIDYAIYLAYDQTLSIYEAGIYRKDAGTYAAGDRFRVSVEGGIVKYYKINQNGTQWLYTSSVSPVYPLLVDTALANAGATITSVVFSGMAQNTVENVVWANKTANISVAGNSLTKNAISGTAWDAGAVSTRALISGDGYLEITASETTTDRLVGLSRSGTVPSYWAIDFGIRQYYGSLYIIESNGSNRGYVGSYAVGDKLKVAVQGGTVKYYKNGTLLYSSTQTPAYPLVVDACLYDPGATINNAVISGALQ
jgi:Tol biopolymer transport system component